MIWVYKFDDGYVLEKEDTLTPIELEKLVEIHGLFTLDVKSR